MRGAGVLGVLTAWAGLCGPGALAQPVLFSEVADSREALDRYDGTREPAHRELDATWSASELPKRSVRIDLERLAGIRENIDKRLGAPPVVLNLLEDVRFQAVFEDAAPTLWGYSLSGRLEGERFGTATLVVHGDMVAGTVRTPTATYSIRSVGGGVHVVEEVEPPTLDKDDGIAPPASAVPQSPPSATAVPEDDGSEIDVFVFYTPLARAILNGTRRARIQIDLAVAEANAAYTAGGAVQRVRLVGAVETRYEERGPADRALFEEISRFRIADDGHMDDVHLIRDAYAADLVHLLTEAGGGSAYVSPYQEDVAFARTGVLPGRIPGSTFVHELGHNMGLQHDRYSYLTNYPFPYSHGYVNQRAFEDGAPVRACWYTIMAYANQCAAAGLFGPPLMRFSNPNQRYPDTDGDPMGIPGDDPSEEVDGPADAVRSLNETRTSVANFRASANRCSYRLTRTDGARMVVGADGGSFTVPVEVSEGCPTAAVSHDAFLELEANPTDEGVDAVIRVAGNDGGTRIGLVTIMGESVEILQDGRATVADVCGRSPWIRDALTDYAGRENCEDVTEFDLAEVYELSLRGITGPIESNDLDGLVNLWRLDLRTSSVSGPIPADVGRLRKLRMVYLNNNELSGPLPPELGRLDLRHLDVSGNVLTGPIPRELGALENLTGSLVLDDNQLDGSIPEEFGSLRKAWEISLAGNALTGDVPAALGTLDRVRQLRLHDNDLSGPVPPELVRLEHLHELSLRGNALTGCIPGGLRDVPINDLDDLGLGYCAAVSLADGGPPDAPGEAGRVAEGSAASLTIVAEPAQDTTFDVTVAISGGEAYGVALGNRTVTIRSGVTEATLIVNTENDDVEEPDGAFTATILAGTGFALMTSRSSASIVIDDDEGPSAPSIVSLAPEDSMLTVAWTAPPGESESFVEFHIRYRPAAAASGGRTWKRMSHETGRGLQRDISGLTNYVEYEVQVRAVSAAGNGKWSETAKGTPGACGRDCRTLLAVGDTLGGGMATNWRIGVPIEEWIGIRVNHSTGRVTGIRISGRGLSGTIPAELSSLTELSSLSLAHNRLTGMVPPELGGLKRLYELRLSHNRLAGTIPPELGDLPYLRILDLSGNELVGTIPPKLGRLANLSSLVLSENRLTGPIPGEFGGLANLDTLRLHENEMTGPIPASLGRLSNLRVLLLSNNRLTGIIPRDLANLKLTFLWLAGNDLTGCVPAPLRDVERNDLNQLDLPNCPPAAVIDLAIESIPLDGRAYGAGERIDASVWFETDVTVSGSPQLALAIGSGVRAARFLANRGTGQLAFRYPVDSFDRDSDGISIALDALSLNGGRILDVDGEDVVLGLGEHVIVNHPSHRVRGGPRERVLDQNLEAGGETLTLDLSRYFSVPEGESLTYGSPTSSDPAVASAIIENGLLKIIPLEDGSTTITATATNASGVAVMLSFNVTVTATMRRLRPWLMGILEEQAREEAEMANDDEP